MDTKINCVLLVDDDEITNYLNKLTLAHVASNVEVAETAMDALRKLECPENKNCEIPDLILLDLNMPGLTGWDFINEYKKLNLNSNPVIIVLTTSTNPDEAKRASTISEIAGLRSKPLTFEMINEIIHQHFTS